jgi:hypothetical protein
MREETIYFPGFGIVNTDETLRIAKERAERAGIRMFIVASTYGHTIRKALELFHGSDAKFIVVGGNAKTFSSDLSERLAAEGHRLVFNDDHGLKYPDIAWWILRNFSEGMKVCVQMTLIATDLGYLPDGEEAIAIAGTGREGFPEGGGADTAIIMEGVTGDEFFKPSMTEIERKRKGRRIKEILCKPR